MVLSVASRMISGMPGEVLTTRLLRSTTSADPVPTSLGTEPAAGKPVTAVVFKVAAFFVVVALEAEEADEAGSA